MSHFYGDEKQRERKLYKIHQTIRDKDRVYLIYERKLTESKLSRWIPLYFSDNDFILNDENITILRDNILSISIEGLKTSKDVGEMWLFHEHKIVRHYTEESKHRLHWIKLTYANKFKKGDMLSIGFNGIGEIQVTIIGL